MKIGYTITLFEDSDGTPTELQPLIYEFGDHHALRAITIIRDYTEDTADDIAREIKACGHIDQLAESAVSKTESVGSIPTMPTMTLEKI